MQSQETTCYNPDGSTYSCGYWQTYFLKSAGNPAASTLSTDSGDATVQVAEISGGTSPPSPPSSGPLVNAFFSIFG